MPSMETENSSISCAEEIKVLANEAFKGNVYSICFLDYLYLYMYVLCVSAKKKWVCVY